MLVSVTLQYNIKACFWFFETTALVVNRMWV